ncbi:MAG: hypothetical protein Ta2A_07630 [Treponemataceae bacterium]|nr:MAG: hypothetical protein Ta2A_07630 [Treponemataceae bacterium]
MMGNIKKMPPGDIGSALKKDCNSSIAQKQENDNFKIWAMSELVAEFLNELAAKSETFSRAVSHE